MQSEKEDGWQMAVKATAYEGLTASSIQTLQLVQGWVQQTWSSWGLLWGLWPLLLSQRKAAFALRAKWLSETLAMNLCLLAALSMVPRTGVRSKEAIWSLFTMKAPSSFCRSTSLRTENGGLDSQGTRLRMEPQKVGAVITMFYGSEWLQFSHCFLPRAP